MIPVKLYKEETLESAENPQEEKYPSGSYIREGFTDSKKPVEVGIPVFIISQKIGKILRTSKVTEILSKTESEIRFKTINSLYRLEFTSVKDDKKGKVKRSTLKSKTPIQ